MKTTRTVSTPTPKCSATPVLTPATSRRSAGRCARRNSVTPDRHTRAHVPATPDDPRLTLILLRPRSGSYPMSSKARRRHDGAMNDTDLPPGDGPTGPTTEDTTRDENGRDED